MKKSNIIEKIIKISKNETVRKATTWSILVLSLFFSVVTYLVFSGLNVFPTSSITVILLLNIDLFLLLLLTALVIRKVIKLWLQKKQKIGGSGIHIKLVLLFMFVAGLPTIMVTMFSAIFFNVAIKTWFSEQVQNAIESSLVVAEDYYKEARTVIANDTVIISQEIASNLDDLSDKKDIEKFLLREMERQNIDELILVDSKGKVTMQVGDMSALKEEQVPRWIFSQADKGGIAINLNQKSDRIRALVRLDNDYDLYLYIGRVINPEIIFHINKAKQAIGNYKTLEGKRFYLEITFTVLFIAIALILFLVSVWIGLGTATGLMRPIGLLISASEKVAKGDISVKVEELDSKDELAQLVSSFNNMTSQISMQQNELIQKNIHIDERRRVTEAILAGVSSGVVNVTKDMKIRMANVRACELLGDLNAKKGEVLGEVVPQLTPIIKKLQESLFVTVQENIEIIIDEIPRQFFVRVIGEYGDSNVGGFVFTFDDITELEQAQRKAAWADVARRIAHEIKNPLTPIQLSAERLLKKYKDEIEDEAFIKCINTIIRQVADIGKMVDEFARFAKMPSPKLGKFSVSSIAKDEIFLQQQAFSFIDYRLDDNEYSGNITCDKTQIGQVFMNLLKNAAESLVLKQEQEGDFEAFIKLSITKNINDISVVIEDNGKGILESDLRRITEPYVTTKSKGTGIGLAIVKKIIEDHKGNLKIENRKEGGAKVTFMLGMQ